MGVDERILMSTCDLLRYVKKNEGETVDAELILNYNGRSTHYVMWFCGRLYDTGCDDERRRTSMKRFKELYPNASWRTLPLEEQHA